VTGSTSTHRALRGGAAGRSGRAAALPPDERRAAIIAAATPLLRRGGHDVTTRQIADAAGVAEGTVFRVFPTKQAIIDAVLARVYDMGETVQKIRAIDRTAPLDDRVRRCAEILADRLSTVIDLMIALRMHGPARQAASRREPDPSSRGHAGHRHRHGGDRQSEVTAAIAEVLAPDAARLAYSPARAAHLLRLLTFAGTHRMINDDDPLGADEVADVLLRGIIRPPEESGLPPPAAQ